MMLWGVAKNKSEYGAAANGLMEREKLKQMRNCGAGRWQCSFRAAAEMPDVWQSRRYSRESRDVAARQQAIFKASA